MMEDMFKLLNTFPVTLIDELYEDGHDGVVIEDGKITNVILN